MTTIAKNEPTTAIHFGIAGGRFNARRSPVTAALRSERVLLLLRILLAKYSNATEETTQTIMVRAASSPKKYTPAKEAGNKAISTSSMIFEVEASLLICGDELIDNLFSNSSPPLYFFVFLLM
jgi:hypothetical protein